MSRDIDAEVGKLVMGYEGEPHYFCTEDGKSACAWVDRRDGPWYSLRELREWFDEQQQNGRLKGHEIKETRRFPHYTTDPAADYSVLVKVRETWSGEAIRDYEAFLMNSQELRSLEYPPEKRGFWYDYSILLYEPGDHSRAALAVLKGLEQ